MGMKIIMFAAIVALSGCAGIMRQDPQKLEDDCKKPENKAAPMCKYISNLKARPDALAGLPTGWQMLDASANDYQTMSELERCEANRQDALRKGLKAWNGLLAWRKKAIEMKDENEKFSKGCP